MSEELEINVDGRVEVTVSPDGMMAYIALFPPRGQGKFITTEQVLEALLYCGVTERIDEVAIERAIQDQQWEAPVKVAYGIPCVNGEDGRIEYRFPLPEEGLRPVEAEDGRVDYYNLNLIHNIKKGDTLAVKTPPVTGRPGITVTGKAIYPNPEKNPQLQRGPNTELSESGTLLKATSDGHVTLQDGKVTVVFVFEVRGDVNFATGNIDFIGNVRIKGDVKSGFSVKAGGDIEVGGLIEGAEVLSGGNILVKSGIAGAGKCRVMAKGHILAKYVENALLESGGNVLVQDGIAHSNVRASGIIRVEGRPGTVMGGCLQAVDEISAKIIGSPLAIQTVLDLGVDPKLREEYKSLISRYNDKKKATANVSTHIETYRKYLQNPEGLSEFRRRAISIQMEEYDKMAKEVAEMEARIQAIEQELQRVQKGTVKARDIIHPGVRITISRFHLKIEEPVRRSVFIIQDGQVKTRPV